MFSPWRVDLKGQQGLKRAVENAQVTTRTIVFHDRHHGLTHEACSVQMNIILCLKKRTSGFRSVVKFIGSPQQPANRGETNG